MKKIVCIILSLIYALCLLSCNNISSEETTTAFTETTESKVLETANLIGWGENITLTKEEELIKLQNLLSKTEYMLSDTEYSDNLSGAISLQAILTYTDGSTEELTFPMLIKDGTTYITSDDTVKNEIYYTFFEGLINPEALTKTE